MSATTDMEFESRRRRLTFSRENFDDYWTALIAKVRVSDDCDRVFSGELPHPILAFQLRNENSLRQLRVRPCTEEQSITEPHGSYLAVTKAISAALHGIDDDAVPDIVDLDQLRTQYA